MTRADWNVDRRPRSVSASGFSRSSLAQVAQRDGNLLTRGLVLHDRPDLMHPIGVWMREG